MLAVRLATCPRCNTRFYICRSCDRGHVYCSEECSNGAREDSLRAIRQRYRESDLGKEKHKRAERRRRRRRRRQAHASQARPPAPVGDHGSSTHVLCGTASVRPSSIEHSPKGCTEAKDNEFKQIEDKNLPTRVRCAICGRVGTMVNLAANRGWWPRRGYQKTK